MFQNLKTVTIGVGYYAVDNENVTPYFEVLRKVSGIQEPEEKGSVLVKIIPWNTYGSVSPVLRFDDYGALHTFQSPTQCSNCQCYNFFKIVVVILKFRISLFTL